MQIIWHGLSCFQIIAARGKGEHVTILIDPLNEDETGLKTPKSNADIVLLTNKQYTVTNLKKTGAQDSAFLIDGPGEYEIKGVYVQGMASTDKDGKKTQNTIYAIEAEDIQICVLGNLKQAELTQDQIEKLGPIDILTCPVGGKEAAGAKEAMKIMTQIEPSVTIPTNYQVPKLKMKLDPLQDFLKAVGVGPVEPLPKLVIKKKDIQQDNAKIVVLAI
ncbi:MAG TPA: MBL fold metallo-hydrolase [Candidatus Paceibacterota bacterium]|nr:MBL fold metallo-hydrolase [Candidatus Pacearchaeota archaeon]HRZ51034.1 MBL fold metallo-hydrolase [Candidatus Paceibacterota bacterium]HSA36807.1 MBL fold metallo-hydrolase [Candidatus Paceibacterota bacterium]